MPIRKAAALGLIVALLASMAVWLARPAASSEESEAQVSWGQWLIGKSGSVQMHFLDLLELVTRHENGQQVKK
ncbi:hypothetical protein [Gallaecimonas pentaromativorans]|uniref:Uncharacterized protein n=1 Tax=Gallaecimonas pentaromativorans TaxID=584787 RepID=A0A3N1PFK8_9GAMM|nr:hypothetical protein [Gallaecimonas pentaromativorans]ROQ23306.1 hypothetical protein EDC28_10844 [Gallaecimonas pentaromativorans]